MNPLFHNLEIVCPEHHRCGEGPIWDATGQRLIWTDIESALLFQFDPNTSQIRSMNAGLTVSAIALNKTGGLVLGGPMGLHLWTGDGNRRQIVYETDGEVLSFNDLIADPQGRIYAGTLHWGPSGMAKRGKLYHIATDGTSRVVDDGIELANGLGFSPDNRILYFTDSAARRIYAYDVRGPSGEVLNKRTLVQIPRDEGIPDGLTVDSEGFVWSAQWYGGQVVRYDPEGCVEQRIRLPVTQVSSVAFGGDDLAELYITTAADPWSSHLAPPGYDFGATNTGGPLYRLRLDVRGKREHLADFT